MSVQIATPEELEALPAESVVRLPNTDLATVGAALIGGTRRTIWREGWTYLDEVPAAWFPMVLLYRPDWPLAPEAWDEGFDAGERDAMDPRIDTHACPPNPYKED